MGKIEQKVRKCKMDSYPDSCRKCPVKKKCGYKYREYNRIPRGIGCLFNKKEKQIEIYVDIVRID